MAPRRSLYKEYVRRAYEFEACGSIGALSIHGTDEVSFMGEKRLLLMFILQNNLKLHYIHYNSVSFYRACIINHGKQ